MLKGRLGQGGRMAMAALGVLSLTACGDASGPSTAASGTPFSMSFRAADAAAVSGDAAMSAGVSAQVVSAAGGVQVVGSNGDTLYIDSVRVAIANVRLRKAGVVSCLDSLAPARPNAEVEEHSGCARLDLGALVMDLPLAESDTAPVKAAIPAGSYSGMKLDVKRLRLRSSATAADSALVLAHPEMADGSVRVVGRYHGAPFTYLARMSAEIEFRFSPPLDVAAGAPDNVTVVMHPDRWFLSQNGALLAPVSSNFGAIQGRIARSLEAYGDRHRRGRGDDAGRTRQSGDGVEKDAEPSSSTAN